MQKMNVIVPLAGPDFLARDGSLRIAEQINGQFILKKVLDNRPWMKALADDFSSLYFVLRDHATVRAFADEHLSSWYPHANKVYLPHTTKGAALSALSAITCCDTAAALYIDLADIHFEWQGELPWVLLREPDCAGVFPVFESKQTHYSYVTLNDRNQIMTSREKERISLWASSGVYIFKNAQYYLLALSYLIAHPELHYNGLLYVCPLANAFLHETSKITVTQVAHHVDFHRGDNNEAHHQLCLST